MLWCGIVDSLPVGITAITVALWSAGSGLELSSLVATVDGGLVYDTVVSVNALAAHTEQIVPGRSALTNMPVRNLSRPAIFRGEAVGLRRDRRNKLHFNRLGTTSISNPSLYIASHKINSRVKKAAVCNVINLRLLLAGLRPNVLFSFVRPATGERTRL